MENFDFTRDLTLVLLTAFLGGFLAKKTKQPLLTGYILGGIIIGAISSGFFGFSQNLSSLAQIGIAFLMFSLGLEFSWLKLKHLGKGIFFASLIQIFLLILSSTVILPAFGFNFYTSLFLGACFSLSSTAVVVKILSDRAELETLSGELAVGWLLIQDLSVLPMMVILPAIANGDSLALLAGALFKSAVFLFLVVFIGKKLIPVVTEKILKTNSRELMLLFFVSLCLILAFTTASMGFSFALGAFLAGFLVSEIGITAAIFGELRPLRDIFAVVFFVTLGFLLQPQFLLTHFLLIFGLTFLVMVLKFLVVLLLLLYLGHHSKTSFLGAISLSQVGEFAAILGQMGLKEKIISLETNNLIISVTLLSIMATPWLIGLAPLIYRKMNFFGKLDRKPISGGLDYSDHVVICGYGRVGRYIGRALQMADIPFIVIDHNYQLIKELKEKGIMTVYGDPCEIDILDYAQVDKAKMLIIAIPDRQSQEIIIANSQTLKKDLKIICRTHQEENQARLRALQIQTIIQPEFEAALAIVNKLLTEFRVDPQEIENKIKRLKIEHGLG